MTTLHPGGCLCGKVRFEAAAEPLRIVHCHCVFCAGRPAVPWRPSRASNALSKSPGLGAPRRSTRGAPAVYRSPAIRRSFCRARGSPLSCESDGYRNEIYLVIGAFDEPDRLPPTAHVHVAQKISWFEFANGLPRFAASAVGPATAGDL